VERKCAAPQLVRLALAAQTSTSSWKKRLFQARASVASATTPSAFRQKPGGTEHLQCRVGDHFGNASPEDFADTAFTFQTGRKQMAQRRFVVAADPSEAAKLLAQPNPLRCGSKRCERRNPPIVFLFGGQGTQYVNMGLNLYRDEPLFRAIVDDCCEYLKPHLGGDLRDLLFPKAGDEITARISLVNTLYTQPSIFVIEYALARFWQSLGIEPAIMAGHSIGNSLPPRWQAFGNWKTLFPSSPCAAD